MHNHPKSSSDATPNNHNHNQHDENEEEEEEEENEAVEVSEEKLGEEPNSLHSAPVSPSASKSFITPVVCDNSDGSGITGDPDGLPVPVSPSSSHPSSSGGFQRVSSVPMQSQSYMPQLASVSTSLVSIKNNNQLIACEPSTIKDSIETKSEESKDSTTGQVAKFEIQAPPDAPASPNPFSYLAAPVAIAEQHSHRNHFGRASPDRGRFSPAEPVFPSGAAHRPPTRFRQYQRRRHPIRSKGRFPSDAQNFTCNNAAAGLTNAALSSLSGTRPDYSSAPAAYAASNGGEPAAASSSRVSPAFPNFAFCSATQKPTSPLTDPSGTVFSFANGPAVADSTECLPAALSSSEFLAHRHAEGYTHGAAASAASSSSAASNGAFHSLMANHRSHDAPVRADPIPAVPVPVDLVPGGSMPATSVPVNTVPTHRVFADLVNSIGSYIMNSSAFILLQNALGVIYTLSCNILLHCLFILQTYSFTVLTVLHFFCKWIFPSCMFCCTAFCCTAPFFLVLYLITYFFFIPDTSKSFPVYFDYAPTTSNVAIPLNSLPLIPPRRFVPAAPAAAPTAAWSTLTASPPPKRRSKPFSSSSRNSLFAMALGDVAVDSPEATAHHSSPQLTTEPPPGIESQTPPPLLKSPLLFSNASSQHPPDSNDGLLKQMGLVPDVPTGTWPDWLAEGTPEMVTATDDTTETGGRTARETVDLKVTEDNKGKDSRSCSSQQEIVAADGTEILSSSSAASNTFGSATAAAVAAGDGGGGGGGGRRRVDREFDREANRDERMKRGAKEGESRRRRKKGFNEDYSCLNRRRQFQQLSNEDSNTSFKLEKVEKRVKRKMNDNQINNEEDSRGREKASQHRSSYAATGPAGPRTGPPAGPSAGPSSGPAGPYAGPSTTGHYNHNHHRNQNHNQNHNHRNRNHHRNDHNYENDEQCGYNEEENGYKDYSNNVDEYDNEYDDEYDNKYDDEYDDKYDDEYTNKYDDEYDDDEHDYHDSSDTTTTNNNNNNNRHHQHQHQNCGPFNEKNRPYRTRRTRGGPAKHLIRCPHHRKSKRDYNSRNGRRQTAAADRNRNYYPRNGVNKNNNNIFDSQQPPPAAAAAAEAAPESSSSSLFSPLPPVFSFYPNAAVAFVTFNNRSWEFHSPLGLSFADLCMHRLSSQHLEQQQKQQQQHLRRLQRKLRQQKRSTAAGVAAEHVDNKEYSNDGGYRISNINSEFFNDDDFDAYYTTTTTTTTTTDDDSDDDSDDDDDRRLLFSSALESLKKNSLLTPGYPIDIIIKFNYFPSASNSNQQQQQQQNYQQFKSSTDAQRQQKPTGEGGNTFIISHHTNGAAAATTGPEYYYSDDHHHGGFYNYENRRRAVEDKAYHSYPHQYFTATPLYNDHHHYNQYTTSTFSSNDDDDQQRPTYYSYYYNHPYQQYYNHNPYSSFFLPPHNFRYAQSLSLPYMTAPAVPSDVAVVMLSLDLFDVNCTRVASSKRPFLLFPLSHSSPFLKAFKSIVFFIPNLFINAIKSRDPQQQSIPTESAEVQLMDGFNYMHENDLKLARIIMSPKVPVQNAVLIFQVRLGRFEQFMVKYRFLAMMMFVLIPTLFVAPVVAVCCIAAYISLLVKLKATRD